MDSEPESEIARARLHQVLMRAPAAVAMQRGPELQYELANQRYRQFFGGRELAGKTRREVLPDEAQLSQILDEVMRTGAPFERREFPFIVDRGQGFTEEAWFDFVCQPMRDGAGQIEGVITFAFEVTELLQARRRIEALASERQQAVAARDEFLSVASHELKSPLTALQLQLQSLLRAFDGGAARALSPERIASRAEIISRQVTRLGGLIANLLDVSRITQGRLELDLEEVDLSAVVREVVASQKETLAAAGCTLSLSLPEGASTRGRWDRARIDQTITNLLGNAVKYGGGQPIALTVDCDGEHVRLQIRDHGIGISAENRARIFERFERAVSNREFAGMGLGLWIVRQIVDAHGGAITVESEPGQGSKFTVTLPLESDKAATENKGD